MNNKAHLRPKDFDSNGDIIPMACKEEKGDLISREALLKDLKEMKVEGEVFTTAVNFAIEVIDNAPTVKSEKAKESEIIKAYTKGFDTGVETVKNERPQGEWIMHIDETFPNESTQECNVCHAEQTICGNDDNFCPNCGADMKGGAK